MQSAKPVTRPRPAARRIQIEPGRNGTNTSVTTEMIWKRRKNTRARSRSSSRSTSSMSAPLATSDTAPSDGAPSEAAPSGAPKPGRPPPLGGSEDIPFPSSTGASYHQYSAPELPMNELTVLPAPDTLDAASVSGAAVSGVVSARGSREPDRPALPGRYVDLGAVARGAFGEVRRVRDTVLDRVLAMKVLHAELSARPWIRRRFFTEVQITAQLQHPGIVPVYDHGELPDGRLWYAMKEVRGRTLGAILEELFEASSAEGFGATPSGWTFRRVVDVFARIAQTVAYAHRQGVVHRDLKPDNVMVGELGEVMVMDWGLARRVVATAREAEDDVTSEPGDDAAPRDATGGDQRAASAEPPASSAHDSASEAALTRHGDVLGTPAYMPPEQALGARDLHGPASDVYALGAMLFHVLTGRPPYEGGGLEVVRQIVMGPPPSIDEVARRGPKVAADLARAAEHAMQREIADRCSAEDLATDVLAWLDGARRREEALLVVRHAQELEPSIAALRARAAEIAAEAGRLLGERRPFDSIEEKRPAWAKEDESERLGREALLGETEWLQAMHAALRIDPDLPEAHAALADHYREQVTEAEAQQRTGDAARFEVMLRAHDRGRHAAFLRGEGALTLVTDPPGAEVRLERYEERDRRLQPVDLGVIGTTPLRGAAVSRGSYRLRVRAPGTSEVFYPVRIERDAHWDGCAPGESEPFPIALPPAGELGEDECYVPAGFAWIGGDSNATDTLPRRRIWIDGFAIGRFPVTCSEWLAFLNALVLAGREGEALLACPRRQLGAADSGEVRPVLGRDGAGQFVLPPDWHPDMPVMLVDWHAATAYARWIEARTGRPWRLPNELEREKAARGVDERRLPWGNRADATFACVVESHRGEPGRAPVSAYPHDESPFGARGLAGNVRDICANAWKLEGPSTEGGRLILDAAAPEDPSGRTAKGGAWGSPMASAWSAGRFASRPGLCWQGMGVRLARSWPAPRGGGS